MQSLSNRFSYRTAFSVVIAGVILLALRLPGIHLPYHQDEWKNVVNAENMVTAGGFFAHPPLMQVWFVAGQNVVGADYF
ncbi:MAG TPA: hypothetical protein VIR98_01765, partial [Candidatus Paceibacterota bacterium]